MKTDGGEVDKERSPEGVQLQQSTLMFNPLRGCWFGLFSTPRFRRLHRGLFRLNSSRSFSADPIYMKIEYNNLYTHYVFNTLGRHFMIPEENRIRIEKYITGIVNNNSSKLYAIYANPEHVHFLVSRVAPSLRKN